MGVSSIHCDKVEDGDRACIVGVHHPVSPFPVDEGLVISDLEAGSIKNEIWFCRKTVIKSGMVAKGRGVKMPCDDTFRGELMHRYKSVDSLKVARRRNDLVALGYVQGDRLFCDVRVGSEDQDGLHVRPKIWIPSGPAVMARWAIL